MIDYTRIRADYHQVANELIPFLKECEELHNQDSGSNKIHREPAREFEHRTGITGISGHWRMPEGHTEATLEHELNKTLLPVQIALQRNMLSPDHPLHPALEDITSKMRAENIGTYNPLLDQLIRLNPELSALKVDRQDERSLRYALYGIVSQFNLRDMNTFIADEREAARAGYIHNKLDKAINQWVRSTETLEHIEKYLTARGIKMENPVERHQGKAGGAVLALGAGITALGFLKRQEPQPQSDASEAPPPAKDRPWLKVLGTSLCVAGSALLLDKANGRKGMQYLDRLRLRSEISNLKPPIPG